MSPVSGHDNLRRAAGAREGSYEGNSAVTSVNDRQKLWYLRHIDLFTSVTDAEIEEIAQLLGDHHIPAGTPLLSDRQCDRVCLIKEGAVRIHAGDSRRPVTLALLGPGKVFGLSATIGDNDPHTHATTLIPSYVCFASWSAMMDIFIRYPHVMVKMTTALADGLFQAETWRARLGMSSPCHRLASLLVDLGEEFGEPTAAGRRIRFRLTQTDLGRMVGLSRETVSRLMAEFGRQGWIVREKGLLILRDDDNLAACGGDPDAA